jgi:hypothetical protein
MLADALLSAATERTFAAGAAGQKNREAQPLTGKVKRLADLKPFRRKRACGGPL